MTAYDDAAPLVTDPRLMVYEAYRSEDEREAADQNSDANPRAPGTGTMVRAVVTFAPGVDPLDLIGVPVPPDCTLPFAAWPMAEAPIVVDGVTVRRYVAPRAKPSFKKGLAKGLRALDPLPVAADIGPPLPPEDFVTWLLARLPKNGAVEPIDPGDPAYARIVAAARAGQSSARINAGANVDGGAFARLIFDLEHVVRRCALPPEAAFKLLRPTTALSDEELRARVADAVAAGLCTSDLRDTIVADVAAEAENDAKIKAREDAARRREVEAIEVDLTAHGLCEFTCPELNPIGPRTLFRAAGLPIGDVEVPFPFRAQDGLSIAMARLRSTGVAIITRKEMDGAGCLPDELADGLRRVRVKAAGVRRYSTEDFASADARSASGRAALAAFRTHAATLFHAVANTVARSELAAYTWHLLLSLGVAYGPEISITNQIAALQATIQAFPRPTGYAVDTIPRAVIAELAKGSAWRFGECVPDPVPAERDPGDFDRVVADAVGDASEVRSREVYDCLHAEGIIANATPSPADRARVSAALGALGFVQGEATLDGVRGRVWRRQVAA
jgi:hypothetical protein